MKKNLIQVSTIDMTDDQWYSFRENGIGASEVGTVLGLNPYKSSVELFYEKIGQVKTNREENPAMFWGTELEALVAEKWQYWEGTQESMMQNFRAGKIIRRCDRVNRFIQNPDYPWLFVSLDRRIHKQGEAGEGALEIKCMSGFSADKWEAGIPPMHLVQLQTQLLVCDFGWGELGTLIDGRNMDVYQFDANQSIQQTIIEKTKAFWDTVVQARAYVTMMEDERRQGNQSMVEVYGGLIDNLSPEPDGSMSYESFLKTRFKVSIADASLQGTDEDLDNARGYDEAGERIKELEEKQRLFSNRLREVLGEKEVLDFGKKGKVTWKANVKGVRSFKVSLKAAS